MCLGGGIAGSSSSSGCYNHGQYLSRAGDVTPTVVVRVQADTTVVVGMVVGSCYCCSVRCLAVIGTHLVHVPPASGCADLVVLVALAVGFCVLVY